MPITRIQPSEVQEVYDALQEFEPETPVLIYHEGQLYRVKMVHQWAGADNAVMLHTGERYTP